MLIEFTLIRAELARIGYLFELYLQNVHRLTTRVIQATPEDLKQTMAQYSNPEDVEIIERLEREAGHKLSDDDVMAVLKELQTI